MEPKVTIGCKNHADKAVLHKPTRTSEQPLRSMPAGSKSRIATRKRAKAHSTPLTWRTATPKSVGFANPKRVKRDQRQLWLSVGLSVIGAVLVGVIMGASLLSIFFSDASTYSQNSIDSHLSSTSQADKKSTPAVWQVYVLQAGNYKQVAGAQAKIRDYRKQGLAAVLSAKAPYRIYLGVSLTPNHAQKLAADYRKKGINVYVKPVVIQSAGKPTKNAKVAALVKQSGGLFAELSRHSIERLTVPMQEQRAFSLPTGLDGRYQQVLGMAQQVKAELSAGEQENLMTMMQGLDQAVQSAKEASIHPSTALTWQIQEGLVRYITTYEQF